MNGRGRRTRQRAKEHRVYKLSAVPKRESAWLTLLSGTPLRCFEANLPAAAEGVNATWAKVRVCFAGPPGGEHPGTVPNPNPIKLRTSWVMPRLSLRATH
jgi:hypothetical protein